MGRADVDLKLRTKVATHFLDRVIFNKSAEDDQQVSYRDLLRKLNEIARQPSVVVNNAVVVEGNGSHSSDVS